MLAAILSGLLAKFYLIGPLGSLALDWLSGWLAMSFYAFTTVIIVGLTHGMFVAHAGQLRTEAELYALNHQLEDRGGRAHCRAPSRGDRAHAG